LHDFDHPPIFTLTDGTGLDQLYAVSHLAYIGFVMGLELGHPPKDLLVDGVNDRSLNRHNDGFVHLVADDASKPFSSPCVPFSHASPLPLSVRLRPGDMLVSGVLTHNRLDPSDIALGLSDEHGILETTGSHLKSQSEQFLPDLFLFFSQLINGQLGQFLHIHARVPFNSFA
jgi:hypothetical protein